NDAQGSVGLEGHAVDRALASDGGIDEMEEAKVFAKAAADAEMGEAVLVAGRLDRHIERKAAQARDDPLEKSPVRVADPQNAPAVAAFRVEDPGEEPLAPLVGRDRWPLHRVTRGGHRETRGSSDGVHRLTVAGGLFEHEIMGCDATAGEIRLRPLQPLEVDERESKAVDVAVNS